MRGRSAAKKRKYEIRDKQKNPHKKATSHFSSRRRHTAAAAASKTGRNSASKLKNSLNSFLCYFFSLIVFVWFSGDNVDKRRDTTAKTIEFLCLVGRLFLHDHRKKKSPQIFGGSSNHIAETLTRTHFKWSSTLHNIVWKMIEKSLEFFN